MAYTNSTPSITYFTTVSVIILLVLLYFPSKRARRFLSEKLFGPDLQKHLDGLTGRVAIVTGGNTGIGYETVKGLAKRGAKVYMAARNESKALSAIGALEREGVPLGSVLWLKLDLADLPGVKRIAEEFLSMENRLDLLVNNAALLVLEEETYPEGVLEYVLTNHLGPWLFTTTLLPLLKKTAKQPGSDVRIITLSSVAHSHLPFINGLKFRSIEDLNRVFKGTFFVPKKYFHYGKSSAFNPPLNILFNIELARRLRDDNVLAISLHPGAVRTSYTYTHELPFQPLSSTIINFFFMTPEKGAVTSLIAAASPIPREHRRRYHGAYLVPYGKIQAPSKQAQDPVLAKELWETTERVVGEILGRHKLK
ncbi:hypothetical protein AX16_001756 [Volvariella volvacea WC 439]|nr:hypothetical protein AX16_001756 [Volvariella volvacea WC 439]